MIEVIQLQLFEFHTKIYKNQLKSKSKFKVSVIRLLTEDPAGITFLRNRRISSDCTIFWYISLFISIQVTETIQMNWDIEIIKTSIFEIMWIHRIMYYKTDIIYVLGKSRKFKNQISDLAEKGSRNKVLEELLKQMQRKCYCASEIQISYF